MLAVRSYFLQNSKGHTFCVSRKRYSPTIQLCFSIHRFRRPSPQPGYLQVTTTGSCYSSSATSFDTNVFRADDVEQMTKAEEAKILPSFEEPHNNALQVQTLKDFTTPRPTRRSARLYGGSILVPTAIRPLWTTELQDTTLSSADKDPAEDQPAAVQDWVLFVTF
ncbi:hypothetical protein EDB19DRAFT_1907597 [Suillus lakei]|nr:hypothetical protein EDB19DRAFT_1907597 [Suillus lakei]